MSIDANGLMRVQHMIPAAGLGAAHAQATQGAHVAVVTVYVTPRDDDDAGDPYGGVTQS